jgi:hypothetical protein
MRTVGLVLSSWEFFAFLATEGFQLRSRSAVNSTRDLGSTTVTRGIVESWDWQAKRERREKLGL